MSWKTLTGNDVTIRNERDYVMVTLHLKSEVLEETTQKTTRKLTEQQVAIIRYLSEHPFASRREISENIDDITEDGVKYNLQKLQQIGMIIRIGPDKGGHWEILENEKNIIYHD